MISLLFAQILYLNPCGEVGYHTEQRGDMIDMYVCNKRIGPPQLVVKHCRHGHEVHYLVDADNVETPVKGYDEEIYIGGIHVCKKCWQYWADHEKGFTMKPLTPEESNWKTVIQACVPTFSPPYMDCKESK